MTGDRNVDLLLIAAGLAGWAVILRVLYSAREGIVWWIRAAVRAAIGCGIAYAVASAQNVRDKDVWLLGGGAVGIATARPRSRYIPRSVRKRVIERDLKGEAFDGKRHHIDHVWPHVKGGSNTADNLRVLDKKQNLRKGAKNPRLRDLW